jgi:hypothetical protein
MRQACAFLFNPQARGAGGITLSPSRRRRVRRLFPGRFFGLSGDAITGIESTFRSFLNNIKGDFSRYSYKVEFTEEEDGVRVTETFDAETTNSPEMQRAGWHAILENFARDL